MPYQKVEPQLISSKEGDFNTGPLIEDKIAVGQGIQKITKKSSYCIAFIWVWLFPIMGMAQFQIPEKPKKQSSVYDYVDLLSTSQENSLSQKLIRYADSTSTQIVVAIIGSTQGENINYLGAQWGQKWGIGQADKDNGIFILLAKADRRIAINTGYGVEGTLTDAISKRIIETIIIPQFKTGNYYGGLDKGADAIFQVLIGEFKEERGAHDNDFSLRRLFPIIFFLVILFILASRRGHGGKGNRGGGRRGSGLDIWDMIILSNMGRSSHSSGGSFGGGGSGSGGFGGGFGGGGFGGGGASGGW